MKRGEIGPKFDELIDPREFEGDDLTTGSGSHALTRRRNARTAAALAVASAAATANELAAAQAAAGDAAQALGLPVA